MASSQKNSNPKVTKTAKAGLVLSVARIERNLRKGNYAKRISTSAAVYMAGAVEYLVAEVLEISGDVARRHQKQRIVPRHIMLAVRNDAELSELLKDVSFPEAGVIPTPLAELKKQFNF